MKKFITSLMLVMMFGLQFSQVTTNIIYYASEIKEVSSEETSEQVTSITSEELIESELDSEAASEMVTEVYSEATSEETSEQDDVELTAETVETASSQIATSESETGVEVISESEQIPSETEIEATLTIDEDGAISSQAKKARSAATASVELDSEENLTTYVNTERVEAGSGESTISITPTTSARTASSLKNQELYYTLDQDGNLSSGSTKEPRNYNGNLLTVYNGSIVEADQAIARTSGGYSYSFYIYDSIDDLKSNTNGTPLSGGGFDATYLETVEQDGNYYYRVKISGYEGYVASENMQLVPSELIQARTYYTVEDGDWVYYSAIDPLTSTEYDRMAISEAPAAAEVGVKYYSDDDQTYYTEPLLQNATVQSISYNSYFQYLPFRSESSYTASNYKSYLNAKGKTSSEYYNETSAFTKVQSYESINSLLMFSMANHESAYGTSTYARACYNFFGRGAVDSDPDQACQYYNYNTATDGILAQSLFLGNGYFDVLDWRYSGTHVGNKASGMNVKYASDTDWGKKISNHAYMIDQYLGGKEEDKYAILEVSGAKHIYTSSSLNSKVKSSGDSGSYSYYDISQMAGTSGTVTVAALKQTSNAYQIYVPTAVKKSSSTSCSYTNSKKGSYPNFGGRTNVSVATNTANYSCDYGGLSNGRYWISKSNTKNISGTSIPYENTNIYQYYSTGEVKNKFVVNSSTNEIKYAYGYDTSGNITRKYIYFDGTVYGKGHGKKIKTVYYVNKGSVTQARTYNTKQQLIYIYTYYSGATLNNTGQKMKNRFNLDPSTGYIKDAYGYIENSGRTRNLIFTYKPNTKYGSHGSRLQYRYQMEAGTSYVIKAYRYRTGSSKDKYDKIYTYQPNTKYGNTGTKTFNDVFWLKNSKYEIDYAIKYRNGKQYIRYSYQPGTIYGKGHGSRITSRKYY